MQVPYSLIKKYFRVKSEDIEYSVLRKNTKVYLDHEKPLLPGYVLIVTYRRLDDRWFYSITFDPYPKPISRSPVEDNCIILTSNSAEFSTVEDAVLKSYTTVADFFMEGQSILNYP